MRLRRNYGCWLWPRKIIHVNKKEKKLLWAVRERERNYGKGASLTCGGKLCVVARYLLAAMCFTIYTILHGWRRLAGKGSMNLSRDCIFAREAISLRDTSSLLHLRTLPLIPCFFFSLFLFHCFSHSLFGLFQKSLTAPVNWQDESPWNSL